LSLIEDERGDALLGSRSAPGAPVESDFDISVDCATTRYRGRELQEDLGQGERVGPPLQGVLTVVSTLMCVAARHG